MDFIKPGVTQRRRRLFQTGVSLFSIFVVLYSFVCAAIAWFNTRLYEMEILQHGFRHSHFFLSLWSITLNIVYYLMYTAIDIIEVYYNNNKELMKLAEFIHKLASYLLFTIIFPVSLYVSILFWGMYTMYPLKTYPPEIDEILPQWINHCLHTVPVLLSVVYMSVSNRHVPSQRDTFLGNVAFQTLYWGLFLGVRVFKGTWVYIVVYELSPPLITALIIISFIMPMLFVPLGYAINSKLYIYVQS